MSQSQAHQEAAARQAHRRWKAEYYAPDWAKKSLSDDGKKFVDDVIQKLYDYLRPYYSLGYLRHRSSTGRDEQNLYQDALVEMVTNWRQDERTAQDGGPAIFSALFRYILAQIVRKSTQQDREEMFSKLLGFVRFVVRDLDNATVLSQNQMRDDVLAMIQNDQGGPLYQRSGSDRRRREYFSFHAFCLDLYRDGTMRNMVAAEYALDTFFNQKNDNMLAFGLTNQWLLIAAEDIYRSVDNAKEDWLYWTFMLIRRNDELGPRLDFPSPYVNEYDLANNSAPSRMAELKALPVESDDLTLIRMLRDNATRQLEHATSDKRRRELRNRIATLDLEEDDIDEPETVVWQGYNWDLRIDEPQ